jgi:hypothetical protein
LMCMSCTCHPFPVYSGWLFCPVFQHSLLSTLHGCSVLANLASCSVLSTHCPILYFSLSVAVHFDIYWWIKLWHTVEQDYVLEKGGCPVWQWVHYFQLSL